MELQGGWERCGFKAWGCGKMRKLSVLVSGSSSRQVCQTPLGPHWGTLNGTRAVTLSGRL